MLKDYGIFVDNKKKIQMSEVDNIYISWVAKPRMEYNYCPLHEWKKDIFSPESFY